jgi:hypothetical protein
VVFEWQSQVKADQVSDDDDEHSGQPSTRKKNANVEKI